jgi:hypothetical protein
MKGADAALTDGVGRNIKRTAKSKGRWAVNNLFKRLSIHVADGRVKETRLNRTVMRDNR